MGRIRSKQPGDKMDGPTSPAQESYWTGCPRCGALSLENQELQRELEEERRKRKEGDDAYAALQKQLDLERKQRAAEKAAYEAKIEDLLKQLKEATADLEKRLAAALAQIDKLTNELTACQAELASTKAELAA